jgi:AAA domain
MINPTLLKTTGGSAPGICIYGATGLKKTHAVHTCPPPVLLLDIGEGGTASLLPWIRRHRNYDTQVWTEYSQDERQAALDALADRVKYNNSDVKQGWRIKYKPAPLVDVVHYDNMVYDSYEHFLSDIGNFSCAEYSTLALDSLQEFSVETQTFSRGRGNEGKTMNEVAFSWIRAQERCMVQLRRLRNYREKGVVIYMTASEDISKDYVNNPLQKKDVPGGQAEEPYSIRGTVNLPGKLAEGLAHLPDILCHVRLMGNEPTWITEPEPLGGGAAWWDAKDRYGRLPKYMNPDVRGMFKAIYGEEVTKAIYAAGRT